MYPYPHNVNVQGRSYLEAYIIYSDYWERFLIGTSTISHNIQCVHSLRTAICTVISALCFKVAPSLYVHTSQEYIFELIVGHVHTDWPFIYEFFRQTCFRHYHYNGITIIMVYVAGSNYTRLNYLYNTPPPVQPYDCSNSSTGFNIELFLNSLYYVVRSSW